MKFEQAWTFYLRTICSKTSYRFAVMFHPILICELAKCSVSWQQSSHVTQDLEQMDVCYSVGYSICKKWVGSKPSWWRHQIWKHFPRYWPLVRRIHRLLVNSHHKGQWCGVLMFSLICAWTNGWVNNRDAGDLRRHCTHYDCNDKKVSGHEE